MLKRTKKRERLFFAKVKKIRGGCWEWQGSLNNRGYGRIGITKNYKAKTYYTHRVAYSWFVGRIPKGMLVCHTCDNPKCCNPKHLFLGDHVANMKDMKVKERHVGTAKINKDIARQIRELLHAGKPPQRVARKFGMSRTHAVAIWDGKYWPKAGGPIRDRLAA